MKANVINLNSTFDLVDGINAILAPLDAPGIAVALHMPGAANHINGLLKELQWIFTVSDLTFNAEVDQNPYGEGHDCHTDDDGFSPPWEQRAEVRSKGKTPRDNNHENPLYRQPRSTDTGEVIEAFGIYTPDLRAFFTRVPLTRSPIHSRADHPEYPLNQSDNLDSPLPAEAAGPAVILCPERLFALQMIFVQCLETWERHPVAKMDSFELLLRMTLFHELGHHLLPATTIDDSNESAATITISEALANSFCEAMLAPRERRWLFAKAWSLQPADYLAYFIPRALAPLDPDSRIEERWKEVMRRSLYRELLDTSGAFSGPEMRAILGECLPPLVASSQFYRAMHKLLTDLLSPRHRPPGYWQRLLRDHKPCAVAAHEEFTMPWATDDALLCLLDHPEPSVQAEAFHVLGLRAQRAPTVEQRLAEWCDANSRSEFIQSAQRAWASPLFARQPGLLDRCRAVIASAPEAVVVELPASIQQHFPPADARQVLESIFLADPRLSVRLEAVRQMAAVLYKLGDVKALLMLHEQDHTVGLSSPASAMPDTCAMNAGSMVEAFRSVVWNHPVRHIWQRHGLLPL